MFTKDKKQAAQKRPAPQTAEKPRRPAEDKKQAAAGQTRRRPAEAPREEVRTQPRRKPAEAPRRKPAEDPRREAAKRPSQRPAEPRRKVAAQPGRPGKASVKNTVRQSRKRPEEARRAAGPRQPRRNPAEEVKKAAPKPAQQAAAAQEAVQNSAAAEEQVFKIQQAPRETPVTSRTAPRRATAGKPAPRKRTVRKEPPQGTSYHRSSPKQKKTALDYFRRQTANPYADPEAQAAAARKRREAREEKKKKLQKLAAKFDAPAIVYTDPKPFNRNRFLIQLVSVLAVASAFVLGLSIFFKVETITVSGAETYSPYKIEEASGIHKGDYLLTFGRARACGQITAKLPYIKSVRIGIKLPNTVNIDVKEAAVVYSIRSGDGDWWLITSEGKVVKQIPGTTSGGYTTVLGVQIDKPVAGQEAIALEAVPEETKAGEEPTEETKGKEGNSLLEPPVTVSATMRLKSALRILVALEENDIVGEAATVNVENLEKIELWYGQKYQVNLGSTEQLEYKIACMYDAILQMSEYQNGMLDVSFTKKKDQVIYTPFI